MKFYKDGNVMMRFAAILLVLVFVSACMLSGLLAKYTATSESSDAARAAAFSVNVINHEEKNITTMDIGTEQPMAVYHLEITNDSEVAVTYDIILKMSEELPQGIKVSIADNKEGTSMVDVEATKDFSLLNNEKYRFSGVGQMSPDTKVEKYLIFSVDSNAEESVYEMIAEEIHAEEYNENIEFTIDIVFTQID